MARGSTTTSRLRAHVVAASTDSADGRSRQAGGQRSGADRACAAGLRLGDVVIEGTAKKRHQAAGSGRIPPHEVGFGGARRSQRRIPLGVEAPRLPGRDPSVARATQRAVDREHLEQHLEAAAASAGQRLQRGHGHRRAVGERVQHASCDRRVRRVRGREVVPDRLVGRRRQQHRDRAVERAAGATDLLVVVDRACRRADVDAEREVRLVVAHAERGRGDHRLNFVVAQPSLDHSPGGRVESPRVCGHVVPTVTQMVGEAFGVGDGEDVDDARPRQHAQRVVDPGIPFDCRHPWCDAEPERGAGQRTAQDRGVRAQLGGDVRRDASIRGGGRGENRQVRPGDEDPHDALIVGSEVVAPARDAVRLVDDEQAHPGQEIRQELSLEARVGQPLRRDQQDVHLVPLQLVGDVGPVFEVGGVHGRGPDAGSLGGADLVAHEGQQGGHDDGRAAPGLAHRAGRDPIDRGLAPAGRLHDEGAAAIVEQGLHRGELVGAWLGYRAGKVVDDRAGDRRQVARHHQVSSRWSSMTCRACRLSRPAAVSSPARCCSSACWNSPSNRA